MSKAPAIVPPTGEIPTCCGNNTPPTTTDAGVSLETRTRFHFSLNVSDLARSVEFYAKLFNVPPAKHYADYAKFELAQPPLVFSLVPNAPASAGALSHLGFPVESTAEVEETARRLTAAGLKVSCQDGTTCGYAKQDKVWVADPDHNFWEIYVVHRDVDPEDVRRGFDGTSPLAQVADSGTSPRVIWEHRVTEGFVERLDFEDGVVDEVRLTGTFNSSLSAKERNQMLTEARRVLKPGGVLSIHGLVASEDLRETVPQLPGVAALVKRVPIESEPLRELAEAGFVSLQITKLAGKPVFEHEAVEMREIKVTACNPAVPEPTEAAFPVVVYKGPFAETTDDTGTTYLRGRRTTVSWQQWEQLAQSAAARQFLFIDGTSNQACPTQRSPEHAL